MAKIKTKNQTYTTSSLLYCFQFSARLPPIHSQDMLYGNNKATLLAVEILSSQQALNKTEEGRVNSMRVMFMPSSPKEGHYAPTKNMQSFCQTFLGC